MEYSINPLMLVKMEKEERKKELLYLASAIMYAAVLARNGIPNDERICRDAEYLYNVVFEE